jgi:hypothetical protein
MKTVRPEIPICRESGGGGNRTRVRGRTGKRPSQLVLQFGFTRRPVAGHLPTG